MPNGLGVGVGSLTNLRLGSMRECVQGIGHNEEQALVTHRFLVAISSLSQCFLECGRLKRTWH